MRRPMVFLALLLCLLTGLPAHPQGQPSSARPPTLSGDLRGATVKGDRIRVIVQGHYQSAPSTLRGRLRGIVRRELSNAVALEVSRAEFEALSRDSAFAHISADATVAADMSVTNQVTGATAAWKGTSGLLGLLGTPGQNGSGIGVAVIDSGISPHAALGSRVVARVNKVSWEGPSDGDPYGHGTHVAGIIGGNTTAAKYVTSAFTGGSAPAVNLIDVRVLGSNGMGYTSDVIAGIDWAIDNRLVHGIRVLNLSLGHPVSESAASDPLCLAVRRATEAGLVVVASAGNYGQTTTGAPILGGITSPGNSPYTITVGAIDTAATLSKSDDRVAPFSSRGPTAFDLGVKPDVVAPGTKLVSLEVRGSYLSTTYPSWHIAGSNSNAYFRLSGTSMAAAVVSGGVALLLDANPNMNPAQVKIALQMGATFMPDAGLIGAGTGSVNFPASLKLAKQGLLSSLLGTVTSLLGLSSGATFRDSGAVTATGGLIDRVYDRSGIKLLGLLDLGGLFGHPTGGEIGVLHLLGTSNPIGRVPANYVVWGGVAGWTSNYYVVWGGTIQSPSGQYVVWGGTDVDSSYVVWGGSMPDGWR